MEFHIDTAGMDLCLEKAQDALLVEDPGSVMDMAGTQMRVSTFLPADDLLAVFARSGQPVPQDRLTRVPSICCGGCSG